MKTATGTTLICVLYISFQSANGFPFFHFNMRSQNEAQNSQLNNAASVNTNVSPVKPKSAAEFHGSYSISQNAGPASQPVRPAPHTVGATIPEPPASVDIKITPPQDSFVISPSGNVEPKTIVQQFRDLPPVMEQTTVSEIWKDINRVLSGDIPQPKDQVEMNIIKDSGVTEAPLTFAFELENHKKTPINHEVAKGGIGAPATLEIGFQPEEPLPQALPQIQAPSSMTQGRKTSIMYDVPPNMVNYNRLKKLNDTYNDFVHHLHEVLEKNKMVYEKQLRILNSIDHPFIVDEINAPKIQINDGRPWYMKYFDMGEHAMEWAQQKTDYLQKKLELYKEKLQEISNDLQYGDYYEPHSLEKQNEGVYDGYFKVF